MEHEQISLGATFTPNDVKIEESLYIQSPKENNFMTGKDPTPSEYFSSTTSSKKEKNTTGKQN